MGSVTKGHEKLLVAPSSRAEKKILLVKRRPTADDPSTCKKSPFQKTTDLAGTSDNEGAYRAQQS